MNKNLKGATVAIFVSLLTQIAFAQQWSGPNDQTSTISRTGAINTGNIVSTGVIQSSNAGLNIGSSTTAVASDGFSLYLKALGNTYLNTSNSVYVTNSGNMIFMPNGGNLGIGTLSPASRLHVLSSSPIGATLNSEVLITRFSTDVANLQSLDLKLRKYSTTDGNWWGNSLRLQRNIDNVLNSCYIDFGASETSQGSGSNELGFGVNNTEYMRIAGNGNVGIGTTSPGGKLEINHAGGQIRLTGGTIAGGLWTNTTEGLYLADWNTGTKGLLINMSTGNVGIGTTAPDAKLAVKGTIHTQEVRVDLNGAVAPDYVFEKDYNLMPLDELKTYLDTNKHLPEVPSAKEMDAHGVNLKEMNLLLLKKIEELTLHMITQQKEIQELKSVIKAKD